MKIFIHHHSGDCSAGLKEDMRKQKVFTCRCHTETRANAEQIVPALSSLLLCSSAFPFTLTADQQ